MKFFLEEVVRRLLNYLLSICKGETREEKLELLLKKCLLIVAMSLILTVSVSSRYLLNKMYLVDLEVSITKLDEFMEKQQKNMDQLYGINTDQYKAMIALKLERDNQLIDIRKLLRDKKLSEIENEELKKSNEQLAADLEVCKSSNKK